MGKGSTQEKLVKRAICRLLLEGRTKSRRGKGEIPNLALSFSVKSRADWTLNRSLSTTSGHDLPWSLLKPEDAGGEGGSRGQKAFHS